MPTDTLKMMNGSAVVALASWRQCYCEKCPITPTHAIIEDDACYVIVVLDEELGRWKPSGGYVDREAWRQLSRLGPPRQRPELREGSEVWDAD